MRPKEPATAGPIGGAEMFVRQAEAQFALFTGKPGPGRIMDAALRDGDSTR